MFWSFQVLLDYFFLHNALYKNIPYQIGILCIFLMFMIPLIVFLKSGNQKRVISILLFLTFISSNIGASIGFQFLFGGIYVYYYQILLYYQIVTMTSAVFYLLNTHNKPQAQNILKITTVVLIFTLIYEIIQKKLQMIKSDVIYLVFNILIWFVWCSLLSCMLVNTLNKIYQGLNNRIKKDNLWTEQYDQLQHTQNKIKLYVFFQNFYPSQINVAENII
ncbi:hypothetical protein pb186bvf_020480 [Paramecium bursaria]